jgi:hypothetical protein
MTRAVNDPRGGILPPVFILISLLISVLFGVGRNFFGGLFDKSFREFVTRLKVIRV